MKCSNIKASLDTESLGGSWVGVDMVLFVALTGVIASVFAVLGGVRFVIFVLVVMFLLPVSVPLLDSTELLYCFSTSVVNVGFCLLSH